MRYIFDKIILVLTFVVGLMGGFDIALRSFFIIIVLDYITGVLSAIYNKKLSSEIGVNGIWKKIGYIFAIILACILDELTGNTNIIRMLVIYCLIANDGISIVENLGEMNVPLPKKVKEVLTQLKKDNK